MMPEREFEVGTVATVLDAIEAAAIAVDRNGTVVCANSRVCELLGRPRDTLLGMHVYDLSPTQLGRSQLDVVIEMTADPTSAEIQVRRGDGVDVSLSLTGRPVSDAPGSGDLRILTVEDRSSRESDEKRFREFYGDLARLSDTAIEQAIALKHHAEQLEERVRERTRELHQANMDAVVMLAIASEAKDADTGAHVRRIQSLVHATARRLGLTRDDAERLSYSSILHDVGKIHIPDRILRKRVALTAAERRIMQTHTLIGEQILSRKPFFDVAREITRMHHENWDGSGYPDGAAGDAIPLSARIVRAADVFDALTSERVYKPAWPVDKTVDHLQGERGRCFDPDVVDALVGLVHDGSLDGTNPGHPSHPDA